MRFEPGVQGVGGDLDKIVDVSAVGGVVGQYGVVRDFLVAFSTHLIAVSLSLTMVDEMRTSQ